jgi:tetratricopeptide (TPR) repeat protein
VAALLVTFTAQAQNFQQAQQLFNQNKRNEAQTALLAIPRGNNDYNNALLALTLLEVDNGHIDEAFTYFSQFFQSSPNPYSYVYALWDRGIFSDYTSKSKAAEQDFMKKLMNDSKAPITLRAMAASNVASNLENANEIKSSNEMYNQLNDLRNWATVGAFENISASGFNKDFGVIEHPEADYIFNNNIGAPVKWFNIAGARNDRWIDLEFHYDVTNSIIYAQTFLQSNDNKEVILLLGVSGSAKVWVNDFMVFSEGEERNTDLDMYPLQVKLQKGNNRILIQLGASEINRSNFMMRFADLKGNLLTDLKSSQAFSPYNKAAAYEVKKLPFFAEQFFEEKVENNTATLIDKLMLASVYEHNDKHYEARKISQQLKKEAPENTIVSEALMEAYNRDNNKTDLTREEEFIKSNDPESLYGLLLQTADAENKEDYEEAQKLLNRRMELYGENSETEIKKLNLLAKRKDYENFLKELDKAYKDYPDNATITYMQYNITQNVTKDLNKADSILEYYLKTHFNGEMTEVLVNDKMKIGKKEEAFQLFNKIIEDKPFATMRYAKMADKYFDIQDYTKAAEWQQKAINEAPYVGSMYYSKGLIYDAAGKKTEAAGCYKLAIQYGPNNYDARLKLRELEGKKDLFSNFKENDITALFKNAPKAADYPNDNSIYLLKDLQQVIYPENGASQERNDFLIKILNKSGIDSWKEVNIPYNSYTQRLIFDKVEILKKDGSKVQAETNENQIVFSSLEVGDAIHIRYKLESSYYGVLSKHFWQDFSFNGGYPVKLARYSLLVPSNKKFTYKMYNTALQPVITDISDNYKLHIWETTGDSAIESESSMPPFSDIGKRIIVSSIPDWSYVANWYSDLSNIKTKADFEIKEQVATLLKGKEKLADFEKAKLIYNYIEENFNYSDVPFLHSALTPQRASRTLNSRLGDCKDLSVLFASMAKEAGLDASLVLVDTRDNGDRNLDIPEIGFNHCIAQLKVNDKSYLIELTDNHLPFAALSYTVVNANGLYIPKDGQQTNSASLVKLNTTTRIPNTINRRSVIRFEGSKAEIERVSERTGAETSSTRAGYKNLGKEDQRKALLRSLSDEFNNPLVLKSFEITNLDNLEDTVKFNYDFTVDKYTSEIAGMQIVKLPWSDALASLEFVSLEKRTYPLNLWSYSTTPYDREVMTLNFPKGKKLVEKPKNVSYRCPSLAYSLVYEVKADRLVVTREVKYLKDQVPVAEYDSFKDVVNKFTEADKVQLAFK